MAIVGLNKHTSLHQSLSRSFQYNTNTTNNITTATAMYMCPPR